MCPVYTSLKWFSSSLQVATLQEGDENEDIEDTWQKCQDRMGVKAISSDNDGYVTMKWESTGNSDDGLSLLDDIWETQMPNSSTKNPKRIKTAIEDDDDETVPKKARQSSGSGETKAPAKKRQGNFGGGNAASSAKTSTASLVRSLNGCDSLLLEATQTIQMFGGDETITATPVCTVTKLIDKVESKITPQSIDTLTQGWQAGQPENRGCELVAKLKDMSRSLVAVKSVALSLQAKPGTEDRLDGEGWE